MKNETKEKIKLPYYLSKEHIEKLKQINKGNQWAKGYKWTPEQIKKRTEAIRNGKGFSGYNGGKGSTGRIVSQITKDKISKANKGKKLSKETIEKMKITRLKNHPQKPKVSKLPLPDINCPQCNILFTRKNTQKKFCSKKCYSKVYFKATFVPKDPKDYSPFKTAKGKPRLEIRGKNHPRWKGGITKKTDLIKDQVEYKQWQIELFKRDNWTCQKCGKKHKIVGHHILNFLTYPELRFDINNGITLCPECHNLFHKIYTVFNNTREQINEFLISPLELGAIAMSQSLKTW